MNIPTSLIVVLLVAAWLLVLVPMVARKRERVHRFPASGSGLRVLQRASHSLRTPRRRRTTSHSTQPREEYAVTVGTGPEHEPMDAAEEWAAEQAQRRPRTVVAADREEQRPETDRYVAEDDGDEDVPRYRGSTRYHAAEAARTPDDGDEGTEDPDYAGYVPVGAVAQHDDGEPFHGVYVGVPADAALHADDEIDGDERTTDRFAAQVSEDIEFDDIEFDEEPGPAERTSHLQAVAEAPAPPAPVQDEWDEEDWESSRGGATGRSDHAPVTEHDDEELRPVPRRAGRGGFDPEAAEATRAYKYQQRRRVTLVLLVATVVFALGAILASGLLWWPAGLAGVLLVAYLAYLRRQVKIEAQIRARRMEKLQRARQVRPAVEIARARAEQEAALYRNRRVVDVEDDDPAFEHLEYHEAEPYRRAVGQ